jgi:MFS family permease
MPEKSLKCIRAVRLLNPCKFPFDRIGASSLHRIAACSLIVTAALSVSLSAQQTGTYGQMGQAAQLPASGRTVLPSGTVSSQQTTSGISNSVLQPSVTVTGDYQGSIPGTPIPAGPVRLSLPDAVKRGLQTNLGIVTSGVSSSIVRAQRAQALSQLFPQISALGPTLGGWLTDNYSWRWIFFINLPVGLLTMFLVHYLVDDPPFLKRRTLRESKLDYIGLSALALGIAALQIALDKGQEDDWFSSHFISTLVVVAVVCLTFLVIWEWYEKDPIVDVRLFKYFNSSAASVMMFLVGAVSFSSTVLMPQFLQSLMGYTAQKAGMVLSGAALLLLIELPVVGLLSSKIQGTLPNGWGLGGVIHCDVHLHQTNGLANELSISLDPTSHSIYPYRLYFHSRDDGRLRRDSSGQEQFGVRSGQLRSQPGKQLRNIRGDYHPCAAASIPPSTIDRAHGGRGRQFPEYAVRNRSSSSVRRRNGTCGRKSDGPGADLSDSPEPGIRTVLSRRLSRLDGHRRNHVLPVISIARQ